MSRSGILPLALALVTAATVGAATDVPATPAEARAVTPTEAADEARARPRPVYGPITSKDPAVRAEVKRLYLQRSRIHDDTLTRLGELAGKHRAESDPDFRWEISREIAKLKRDLELRSVELGLEIARLNEDAARVAEFEMALDQLRNPEKYRPAPLDPSVQEARARAASTASGGAR